MKKSILNPFSFYVVLWIAYLLQGLLYKEGSLPSQLLGLLILMVSFKHFLIMFKTNSKPLLLKGLNVMLALYTIYGILLILSDGFSVKTSYVELSTINYLKGYYLSIMPIFSGYYYTTKGYLDVQLLKKWVPLFVIVGMLVFYREELEKMAKLLEEGVFSEDITNNSGYFILGIIPCSFVFYKKPLFQYTIMVICMILILMSMKRGAILVTMIVLLYMVYKEIRAGSYSKKVTIISLAIIALVGITYYIQEYLINNDYFLERIESTMEGKTSGRDDLYTKFATHILNNMTITSLLVGEGAMATVKLVGKAAHNDWLEIMICHGLIGIWAFIYYWRTFFLSSFNKRNNVISNSTLTSYLIMYLLMTFFSMSIGGMCVFADLMIGFSLANGFNEDRSVSVNKN